MIKNLINLFKFFFFLIICIFIFFFIYKAKLLFLINPNILIPINKNLKFYQPFKINIWTTNNQNGNFLLIKLNI